jgi:hypothetical protein
MAMKEYPLLPPIGTASQIYEKVGLSNTPQNDIHEAGAQVYGVDIDCLQNPGEDVYVKFYDNAAPTVGTTDAEMVLRGKSGVVTPYVFPIGIPFVTALSVACVKEAGGGAGTTGPSGTVNVTIHAGDD